MVQEPVEAVLSSQKLPISQ